MKLRDFKNFIFGTLRGRIILGVALVHAVMMTLFIADLTIRQRSMLHDRQVEEATALVQSLSTSAAVWIESDDISGLQELIENQRRYPELLFAMLTDESGLILAHTDLTKQGLYLQDIPVQVSKMALIETPELIEVLVPTKLDNRLVGWTCVGISRKSAEEKLTEIVLRGMSYAIVAIAIGSFIAWWMGRLFTRRLYAVQNTISEVKSGNRTARSNITGVDEAASIASEFNTMLDTLDEQRISLIKSETKYQMLLWSIRVGVVVHGPDTQILMSNPMAQELLGLSEKQMMGKTAIDPDWHFLREDGSILPQEEYPVNQTLAKFQPLKDMIVGVHRPDRKMVMWVLVNTELVLNEQSEPSEIIITYVDITERKHAEETLHHLNRELHAISNCNQVLMRAEDEQTLLNEVCNIISHEAGYRLVWVGYAEHDNAKTVCPVAWAGFDNGYVANAKLSWSEDTKRGCGPGGESIRSGKIVYIQDLTTDPQMDPWRESALQRGYRSLIALPLKDENANVFGVLMIYSTGINAFTPDEIRLLDELSGDLAFGIMVLRNRSERKRAEEELRQMNERFSLATNAAHLGVWDWDLQKNELIWDDRMYTLYGIKRDDFAGAYEAWLKGVHPDDRAASDEISRQARLGEREYDTEFRVIWPDGSVHYLKAYGQIVKDTHGVPLRMTGINFDITESKLAEEALFEGQQVFRTLVENSPDIIARYNCDCKRTYVNPVYLKVANISQQELLSTTPIQRSPLPSASAVILQNLLRKVLNSGVAEAADVIWLETDSLDYWYNIYAFPEFDREGRVTSVMTVSRDITERKQAEEEIRKLNQELEKRVAERTKQLELMNKELEAFSYSVSHDLRAPLRGIDGFSQVLLEQYHDKLDEQGKTYLQRVRIASQRMAQLIDDMLNLSRMSRTEINMRQVKLSEMAQEIIDDLYNAQPDRQAEFIIQEGIKAQGDERLLRIVLENLLGNAWKFTSKHPTAHIEFGVQKQDERTVYFVRDDGAGFDMKYAQKLFGAFQRLHTTTEFQGTGIGLATVQRVIHRHGGEVWAEGEVEKGATFYFTIP